MMPNSPELLVRRLHLLRELQRRRTIRGSFTSWAEACGYRPAKHHRLLIERLEQIARGETRRLAVFMPPGSAKSTYCSVLFPAWFLAREPSARVLAASHTVELAAHFGRRVRNLVVEQGKLLGLELAQDSQAASRWATSEHGEYMSAGAGVGISGFRGDLVVMDDPIRTREDADSETNRNRLWEWYQADVRPRLRPGARIILVQTRWHEDDLAGRILAEMVAGGEEWTVLCLPAEALPGDELGREPGELLWTDDDYGYSGFLRNEKANQTPRNWSALYQQQPAPEGGNFFRDEWLHAYVTAPDRDTLAIYGASDYAVTADGGDYTVHVVLGLDPDDRLYLLDLWRGRTASDVWVQAWCDLVKLWKPLSWAEESGQITTGIGPYLSAEANRQKAYCHRVQIPHRGRDKPTRAQSIRARMARPGGGLYVPVREPWWADLRAELLSFPAGKHDDQADALGLAGQLLDEMVPGRVPAKPEKPEKPRDYRSAEDRLGDMADDWKAY